MANTHTTEPQVEGSLVPVAQRDMTLILEAGYLLIELGKHKEAEEIFTGAAALIPHSEVPHLAMGNLHFAQGRFSPALKCHTTALQHNADSAIAHASAAEALFFLKRQDEGKEHLDKALSLPDDGTSRAFAQALQEAHELGVFR